MQLARHVCLTAQFPADIAKNNYYFLSHVRVRVSVCLALSKYYEFLTNISKMYAEITTQTGLFHKKMKLNLKF